MLALALFAVLVPLATARPANLEWGAGQGFVAPFLTNSMTHAPPYPKNGNDVYLTDGPYNNWTYGQNQVIKWVSPYNQGDFCFDAGLEPKDGTRLKIWQCYPGAPQQTWDVADGHIKLAGKNLCVDVPNGNKTAGFLQLWTCDKRNPNQIFGEFCGSRGSGPYPSGG
ncbi:carbohydrate-binding module family 13 protein/putative endo-1,3-beta-glucanase [Trichosporon asahii var. asahii CBS 8904]|uniref:Carbohydrate-binding module family 13 protein/putative endo-1,3-beta-glucanase n=1 Tax=Trichosporon asahii var. asahii (strain CBS 8904) TaxID=1220162 RepID=K1VMY1_TRIAC|nr:carbohydrate-binding module family 13 protein/putative endo-1,3-beta-glucanase [Trichosporon asahii var. asahii CBS 8904]